ncbi:hypothetical protein [Mucilaginibacter paludis]|uniref:Uncharacterized protein n=1 Tax=Mucilaginibacter paludis DSM 18603 TaxID=714943 RepID=H1YFC8_9SPHI|nr:hypothetical protein [Mucilaginibacter paludis]EHQ26267.1 hypothetical protein Mucpa_2127 [Mucilaginibacter paludis DSM 18603]
MKIAVVLMILLSIWPGVDVPDLWGYISLHSIEFPGAFTNIKANSMASFSAICWLGLLVSHGFVVSLPFLTRKPYFTSVLIMAPFLFVLFFVLYFIPALLLLIPFIAVWLIALMIQFRLNYINKKGSPKPGSLFL